MMHRVVINNVCHVIEDKHAPKLLKYVASPVSTRIRIARSTGVNRNTDGWGIICCATVTSFPAYSTASQGEEWELL